MIEPIIQIRHLRKSYGNLIAVNDISFDVAPGECLALLGPNGAGKSTLMKMIYGICRRDATPDALLHVFNLDPNHNEIQIKYLSGIVQQDNNIDEELNVKENLEIYAKFYAIPAKEAESRINELLAFMELTDKKFCRVRELSGGMQRRLIIARALLNNPRLLILDEPTTGLDPQVRHLIWNKIRHLKEEGTTVLLTTHYLEEAFNLADNIMILNQGEALIRGNPKNLMEHHIETYVLEIQNKTAQELALAVLRSSNIRRDEAHDILFVYSNVQQELQNIAADLPTGSHYLRQTTLEDLFLKLTGRQLKDEQ